MLNVSDQIGNEISLAAPATRIVSLVPSQTELLFDLGLGDQLVGRTKFCVYPESLVKSVPVMGGTKNFHIDRIKSVKPDLIIANKEENDKDRIITLQNEYPVWTSDIKNLSDALDMINSVGILTGTEIEAQHLETAIVQEFAKLEEIENVSTAYCIWHEPMMFTGGDTFINAMLNRAGFTNVFSPLTRYPTIDVRTLQQYQPDVILLSSEPFPFKQKHIAHYNNILPESSVMLVDGTFFSWYGSRLRHMPGYFRQLRAKIDLN